MSTSKNLAGYDRRAPGATETGAAMVIALIMLLVLTLLGTATARMTLLEERMTGNTQDNRVAFQAAEAALRDGETFLRQPTLPGFDDANGLYQPAAATGTPVWKTVNWTAANQVRTYGGMAGAPGSLTAATATYLIEELPHVVTPGESLTPDSAVDAVRFYRLTARGVGAGGKAQVTLQTTFKR